MNIFTKTILIISSIFVVMGLVAIIVAVALGAKFEGVSTHKLRNYNNTYVDVTSLDIRLDVGEIEIKEGTEFKIEAKNVGKNRFKSVVDNGVWKIEENSRRRFLDFMTDIIRGFPFVDYSPKIVVYIPKDVVLDKFDITIGAGNGTVDILNTKEVRIKVGTGELDINNLVSEKSNIESGVGSISIDGVMSGYNKVECGVGSVKLHLIGNEKDYNYKYSVGVGEITINGIEHSGTANGNIDNEAKNSFEVNCGVGNIVIEIKE